MKNFLNPCLGALSVLHAGTGFAAVADPEALEFFESRIRPVLAQDCYECHRTGGKVKGGLALDHRAALLEGGDSGPAIKPGQPEESLLIAAIRHDDEELEMPKSGARLEDGVIADFVKWIEMGAPDPRDEPASEEEVAADSDWQAVMQRRKNWWSFQPIAKPRIPEAGAWTSPVDRFIGAAIEEAGLTPAGAADRRTLIRRLSFALRGLPPPPGEVKAFVDDQSDGAYERLADRYLASPRFGERWARHWMDWLRYADSHGSEGDPEIPNSWRYRDYLIRALNADVPYDQLVREHIAGDLLESPRVSDGLNESALGTAQLRMVFHGFAPTDALDEQVRFTDDQINVLTKGFLGLTVSCARCHDHKFDAISQKDFYALYGIFASTLPGMLDVNAPDPGEGSRRRRMAELKEEIRRELAEAWLAETLRIESRLKAPKGSLVDAIKKAGEPESVLYLLHAARAQEKLAGALDDWQGRRKELAAHRDRSYAKRWNLGHEDDLAEWTTYGKSAGEVASPGEFAIAPEGPTVLTGLYPAGVYTHLASSKDRGILLSPRTDLDGQHEIWARIAGDGESVVRYAVQNYPRNGTIYPFTNLKDGSWRWVRWNLDYWEGDRIHFEATTARDQPIIVRPPERSWVGVSEVLLVRKGEPSPPAEMPRFVEPLLDEFQRQAGDAGSVARVYLKATQRAIGSWERGTADDGQAELLAALLGAGVLPNTTADLPGVRPLLDEYRQLEAAIRLPTRSPGVWEADSFDQPLFVRGDHKQAADAVPRRFLEAIDAEPYGTTASGRLELAEDILRPDNPFAARVIVNRLWHHLFGRGLVATTDNFGRLGEKPSHPELLDFLAAQFREDGWSLKGMIRELVISETWKRSSSPLPGAREKDPGNILLSHFRVRRLEAEAIRDNLLAVTGRLSDEMYGDPVAGGSPRRSVYVRIKRNALDPFLSSFDAPVPASTKGRRDVTNVPAQSLAMLNSDFVIGLAEGFARREQGKNDASRASAMFERALSRPPSEEEAGQALEFVRTMEENRKGAGRERERLEEELDRTTGRLVELREEACRKVGESRGQDGVGTGPVPIALWDFEENAGDRIGGLHAELQGGARIEAGALVVGRKKGYASTSPLASDLGARTLEAWVQLDTLDQRAGGVMTIQSVAGGEFDSIVFAEREPRMWMAGSNSFQRTQAFRGTREKEAGTRPVHLAVVWGSDGTVAGYRNGKPYGKPYKTGQPPVMQAGESNILFGLRHGPVKPDRLLKGRILEARLYDRPLTADEIARSATQSGAFIPEKVWVAALPEHEQAEHAGLRQKESLLRDNLESLGAPGRPVDEWADLAHALFNLKEFIYVR